MLMKASPSAAGSYPAEAGPEALVDTPVAREDPDDVK
jgi:hypothetical protein